jgi:hypothetical protein
MAASPWGRKHDRLGLGFAVNSLSSHYKDYRASMGMESEDENVLEFYYRWVPVLPDRKRPRLEITPNLQLIENANGLDATARVYGVRMRTLWEF